MDIGWLVEPLAYPFMRHYPSGYRPAGMRIVGDVPSSYPSAFLFDIGWLGQGIWHVISAGYQRGVGYCSECVRDRFAPTGYRMARISDIDSPALVAASVIDRRQSGAINRR